MEFERNALILASMPLRRSLQLPYLVHTNRELGLMLRGVKPLAYFYVIDGDVPDVLIKYLRMFDRYVALGRFIKKKFSKRLTDLPHLESHRVFYALPGEEWRLEAMRTLLDQLGAWSHDCERREGELLGYEDWQNDVWLAQWQPRVRT